MKRIGHVTNKRGDTVTLVEVMAEYENVQKAYNKARKCKRYRKEVLIFTKDKEENLEKVRNDIINLTYKPSEYRYFKVFEPKERQIMALPFYDRVIQHTVNNVLEPLFNKRFIFHSYACRKGKGMHGASDTLKDWLHVWQKFHPEQPLYVIKADIHHYFQSINHDVLKAEIRKVIKDTGTLRLTDEIIDHNGTMPDGTGIPVGNLTSQLFANVYLNRLDQYVKHNLGARHYMRYMDDFIISSPDKEQLRYWLADIERFLREELRLELNPKTTILAAKNGIDFVGYKHRATHRKVRRDSIKRIKRTIKKYQKGTITKEQLQKSIDSWTGHAGHADSYHLQKKIIALAADAIKAGA
ncbi:reverse transcriptase/maturase family protein [Konateibacter massiliensis]|uniref:reverse transcriptase/maturase family protein n=1 Tax=Konateibacter massiliensis TaxID=2002841 RepID=UPI000C150707|nr:reverse transcriptase/maturase family protein [Konateibacter massiliensis]